MRVYCERSTKWALKFMRFTTPVGILDDNIDARKSIYDKFVAYSVLARRCMTCNAPVILIHMIQYQYIDDLKQLSVVARQCIAVTCFERYCRFQGLSHPAIDQFIDHEWQITSIHSPNDFGVWEQAFQDMPITAQGDPYPESLVAILPLTLRKEFDNLILHVFETSATTWYGHDPEGTVTHLVEVLKIIDAYNIALPNLEMFRKPLAHLHGGWGMPLSEAEARQWREAA